VRPRRHRAWVPGPSTSPLDGMKIAASLVIVGLGLGVNALFAAESTAVFTLPSGVAIRIVEAPFDPAGHRVKGCGTSPVNRNAVVTCLIDGLPVFGSDSQLPDTYVKSITASFKGRSYALDTSQMYNAWGKRPLEMKVKGVGTMRYFGGSCRDALNCILRGLFSDAAGSYIAEWQIIDGTAVRTALTDSGDIVGQLINHIDPPVYE
jgi:hypothetical protein